MIKQKQEKAEGDWWVKQYKKALPSGIVVYRYINYKEVNCKGQLVGEDFTGVYWYKNRPFFCVANTEKMRYIENHSVKCKKVENILVKLVHKLRRVGHI